MKLSDNAIAWLANGQRGISSETIFTRITGVDALGDMSPDVPHDPADLRRCRLLLEACPEIAADLDKMRDESPAWAALVDRWPELCNLMDEEAPTWRTRSGRERATKTYELMRAIRENAKA